MRAGEGEEIICRSNTCHSSPAAEPPAHTSYRCVPAIGFLRQHGMKAQCVYLGQRHDKAGWELRKQCLIKKPGDNRQTRQCCLDSDTPLILKLIFTQISDLVFDLVPSECDDLAVSNSASSVTKTTNMHMTLLHDF